MKYVKEELEKFIFDEQLSYEEIGRRYKVSGTYIKKISGKLGIILPRRAVFPVGFRPANKKQGIIVNHCLNCGKETDCYAKNYCSLSCFGELKSKNKYKDFIENNEKYCRASYSPRVFKPYILEEQNNECAICKIKNKWNDKTLIFVLDHIDGDASNNKRNNLRLVCHNCDSQLDTYKSKNKNSARKERYLLNYKN